MDIRRRACDNMISNQLLTNHIVHAQLLKSMADLPRQYFVPPGYALRAYGDADTPLFAPKEAAERGQRHLLEPMVFARMVQAAAPVANDKTLVIGAGTGYAVAVLAMLTGQVYGVESDELLASHAQSMLRELKTPQAKVVIGQLAEGYHAAAPYTLIFINGGLAELPGKLAEQLADGGRIVGILNRESVGQVVLWRAVHGLLSQQIICETAPRTLPGLEASSAFRFE